MATNMPDNSQRSIRSSIWSQLTLRLMLGLAALSAGLGYVIGYAISRHEPGLFIAILLIQIGYLLSVLDARARARELP